MTVDDIEQSSSKPWVVESKTIRLQHAGIPDHSIVRRTRPGQRLSFQTTRCSDSETAERAPSLSRVGRRPQRTDHRRNAHRPAGEQKGVLTISKKYCGRDPVHSGPLQTTDGVGVTSIPRVRTSRHSQRHRAGPCQILGWGTKYQSRDETILSFLHPVRRERTPPSTRVAIL